MIYFIDESGIDQQESKCKVLAAVAIAENSLSDFILKSTALKRNILAMKNFHELEPKGKKLLCDKKFRLVNQLPAIGNYERKNLLYSLFEKNKNKLAPTQEELTALGQASLDYVTKLLDLCSELNIKIFGSVVSRQAIMTSGKELQKDYTYLFQRIYLHLTSISPDERGLIVFDELDKALAQNLIKQMRKYFLYTHYGRERSKRIIPEPFFVHSDLTTATQLADIIAYILNFGFQYFAREKVINNPNIPVETTKYKRNEDIRSELIPFANKIFQLQFQKVDLDSNKNNRIFYGIVYFKDLRTKSEKLGNDPDK